MKKIFLLLFLNFLLYNILYAADSQVRSALAVNECQQGETVPLSKASLMRCFGRGQFGILAVRNSGGVVFAPELSDDYQVFAVGVSASLRNCSQCKSVRINVFGKVAGGKQAFCASQQPEIDHFGGGGADNDDDGLLFNLCKTPPISVVGFNIKVEGLTSEVERLFMRRLTFFYKMYMSKGCDSQDQPFPFIPTMGLPCVLPYVYNGVKTYDCLRLKNRHFCGTQCQPERGLTTVPLTQCIPPSSSLRPHTFSQHPPLILMSSRRNTLGNVPHAAIDRKSASDPGLCLATLDSERRALEGASAGGSELNWLLVDLGRDTVLRQVRLWRDSLPLEGVQIWVFGRPPRVTWSSWRRKELTVNRTEGSVQFCGVVKSEEAPSGLGERMVSTVHCAQDVIGRWVLIQKRTMALGICEVEFFKDSSRSICYSSDDRPSLDCEWKLRPMKAIPVANHTFDTAIEKDPFYFDYVYLQGVSDCIFCNSTFEIRGLNISTESWDQLCTTSPHPLAQGANRIFTALLRCQGSPLLTRQLRIISSNLERLDFLQVHRLVSRGVQPTPPLLDPKVLLELEKISREFLAVSFITTTTATVGPAVDLNRTGHVTIYEDEMTKINSVVAGRLSGSSSELSTSRVMVNLLVFWFIMTLFL